MKKLCMTLFTLFVMSEGVMAQTITVPDVYASPGQTVAFSLNLSGGRADSYIALQFKAQFPATGFNTAGGFTVSSSWPGANSVINKVDETGLVSIPFDCVNVIQGSDVRYLVTINFKVDETVAAGDYDVTLKDIQLQYREENELHEWVSKYDSPADVTFKVKVQDTDVTLDENSPLAPTASDGAVDIKVIRTIKKDKWSTICLPFRMSADQWKEAFGDDAQIRRFTSYEKDGEEIKVSFGNALTTGALIANRPYIIKTKKDITGFSANSTIVVTAAKDENYKKTEYNEEDDEDVEVVYGYMQGVYQAGLTIPAKSLFLSNDQIFYSKGLTMSKAFRAYFWFKDVLASYESGDARILMIFDDSTTTIQNIETGKSGKVQLYTLSGQRVAAPSKGIYIQSGKKVVIK